MAYYLENVHSFVLFYVCQVETNKPSESREIDMHKYYKQAEINNKLYN